ncbi:hypothetical protein JX265_005305 [Neoarthrinium moseri]|uniref:HhH-GPD domain-containing protein n=1 Tax=Neoarthrinium moseri TaxID=1658444 RepID=A0A9P9WNG4_9PEZI|nr:hypothetical protein JX265_005305 [Neoarthrinium moseri]
MGDVDRARVAYPVPDPKKIFNKVMDWLEANHMSEQGTEPASQLADDYMVGWEASDQFEKKQLGLLAANGQMGPNELKEVKRLSLLRGVEEWDMLIACAKSMRAETANHNPLDGQDTLSYLAKIIKPDPLTRPSNHIANVALGAQQRQGVGRGDAIMAKPQAAPNTDKKRKRQNESHFFAGPDQETPTALVNKRAKKRARRAAKRASKRAAKALQQAQGEDSENTNQPHPTVPVLKEAAVWYRSSDNAKAPTKKAIAPQAAALTPQTGSSEVPAGDGETLDNEQQEQTSEDERASTIPRSPGAADIEVKAEELDQAPTGTSTALEGYDGTLQAAPEERRYTLRSASQTPKKERVSTSKYFTTPKSSPLKPKSPRPPRGTVSALPFPTLSAPQFGLVQEKLADDPFRLLIAITFLVRTPGRTAIPTYFKLMEKYPTPEALVEAKPSDISAMIKHLGLSVVRAAQIQKYARIWLATPPTRDARYGVKNYPRPGDGKDVRAGEAVAPEDQDPRPSAWEIGHMTQGAYALDSWRIFCRDALLGRREGRRPPAFQPEWMRVLPLDKELRAYLRWMWMREGWDWDPHTGDRAPLARELRDAVEEGRVAWDNTGALQIVDSERGKDIG